MTNEDKKLISEYMGWFGINHLDKIDGNFDLNDASLVVAEMQKRGEYADFIRVAYGWYNHIYKILGEDINFTAWLMSMEEGQAKNFFKSMVEWRKGK